MDLGKLLSVYTLKDRTRTGWVLRDVSEPESVGDHTWGTAFLCLLFADRENVDRERILSIALVHDLAEAETGDFATRVHEDESEISREEKARLEAAAIDNLTASGGLPAGTEIRGLWQEYEDSATAEALFVRDMNMIDMCLQALKYEKEKRYTERDDNPHFRHFRGLDEFFATVGPRLSTSTGRELYREIETAYRLYREAGSG